MLIFVVRRILLTVPILFGVSLVVFGTIKIIPGDPLAALLGPTSTPEARAALSERLGLDDPLPLQYLTWLGNVVQGDLGVSVARQTGVLGIVADAFWNTLILTAFAATVAVVLGVGLGAVAALRRGKLSAVINNALALFFISTPQYTIGLLLIIYLGVGLAWFPISGMYSSGGGGLLDLLWHLILPGVTAALVPAGIIARMFRSTVLDVMSMDFIDAYRARGLSELRIIGHAFHNTLPTLLTVAGLQVGYLLGGVIFVETVFAWPGVGLLVFDSIAKRDLAVIQAGVMISALAFVVINLLVDISHAVLDPRARTAHA